MGKSFLWFGILFMVLLLLLFPVFLEVEAYYDLRSKKVGFCLLLYKKFRIFGGYIESYPGGIAVHTSPTKAYLIGYREIDEGRKKYPFKKHFTLKGISLHVTTGAEYFLPFLALQKLKNIFVSIQPAYGELFKNRLWLVEGDEFSLAARISLRTNFYIQIKAFIEYGIGRIKKEWKTKKSTS